MSELIYSIPFNWQQLAIAMIKKKQLEFTEQKLHECMIKRTSLKIKILVDDES